MPPAARWGYLRDELHHQVGDGLNRALGALEEGNASLEGVLQHIDFNRRVGTTTVSDRKWRDLIDHFSKYRLRNEDFEFPDLLGAVYEYLIRDFADSAGKKGGEFYTPRQVVKLMVRLVDPREGMAVYDPCSGSGGMLIYARDHVAEGGGDPRNLVLAGQENNGTTWSISKMNMLLHGIRDADLQNDDTLTNPRHVRGGELQRFDRVITNPPFSQNYDKASLAHTERFVYGYTPEGGKKADLMFLQHMLAVLKRDGIVATVMPHGVLFRGGDEGTIRRRIIEDDLLDCVIGLGPNLFYGTGIPAAILILRAKGSKPPERRCKVLFINADRDYGEGRAQNHLRPRDEQKITATYRGFADVDGFARVVGIDELADNDFNCNIRRYADNSPPPEPQDVRAHLHGGVPTAEIDDAADLLQRAGLDPATLFADRGDGYADWRHEATSEAGWDAAHRAISHAVAEREAASPWPQWWAETVEPMLRAFPGSPRFVGQGGVSIPPVRITDPDFAARIGGIGAARAKASEMEHAARHHIRERLDEDPAYDGKLSERIDEILERLEERWEQIALEFEELIADINAGRSDEDDTGLDPTTELPFHSQMAERVAASAADTAERLIALTGPPIVKQFVEGEGFAYLGRSYRLTLTGDGAGSGAGPASEVRLERGRFHLPAAQADRGATAMRRWYTEVGGQWLRRRILPWAARLGEEAVRVEVRDLGYRWGSARPTDGPQRINVHWAALQLPPSLIDYVLAHELAHLHEINHTPDSGRPSAGSCPATIYRRPASPPSARTSGSVPSPPVRHWSRPLERRVGNSGEHIPRLSRNGVLTPDPTPKPE